MTVVHTSPNTRTDTTFPSQSQTLDLPERLLPKISSRLGNDKVVFKPYTAEQLKKIVHARLEDASAMRLENEPVLISGNQSGKNVAETLPTGKTSSAFDAVAIELASRKVAAVSGDARRVLELCRRAAELAETEAVRAWEESEVGRESGDVPNDSNDQSKHGAAAPLGQSKHAEAVPLDQSKHGAAVPLGQSKRAAHLHRACVAMRHIKDAMFEMFQSPHMRMLEAASRHDRIFLCALLLELKRTGVTEACTTHVMRTHEQLCRTHGESLPPAGAAAAIACRLASAGLLLSDPGRRRAAQRVCLNVPMEDVVYALKDERRVQERKVHAATAARRLEVGATAGAARLTNGANGGGSGVGGDARGTTETVAPNAPFGDWDRGDVPWIRQIDL